MTDAPPVNEEAEREVLGALLVTNRAMPLCQELGLQPEHFYFDRHRHLYRAATQAAREGAAGDELATWTAAQKMGLADQLQRGYVSELAATVRAAGNVRAHAQRVIELAGKRSKLEGAQKIQQGVHEHDDERSAALIQEGLELVATDYTIEAEPTSGEEILDEIFTYFDRGQEGDVFELPWPELNDCVLGGYRRKQLSALAGWTNMGKSWVVDQMLASFGAQGYRTAIFATEMAREERAARWLTSQTGVALEKIIRNRLSPDDHRKLAAARAAVDGKLPFDYFEAFGWSAERIAERIVFGNYDVVAIDPITEIPGFEKAETASAIVRRFAQVAGRSNCHVIAVCHLNRNRLRDPNGVKPRPLCLDLKGSGALETLAHAVLFLHRDQDDDANVLPEGELYFDKVRNGIKKKLRVWQTSRTHQFCPVEPEPTHEQAAFDVGPTHEPPPGHDQKHEERR